MAYEPRNLSALAYANGFTLWHYKSKDGDTDDNYFSNAATLLRRGDFIMCNWDIEGRHPFSTVEIVTDNDGREVKVTCLA